MSEQTKHDMKEHSSTFEVSLENKGYAVPRCGYCNCDIRRDATFVTDDFGIFLPMHTSCAPEYEDTQYWRTMPQEEKTRLLESARRKVHICELAASRILNETPKEYVSLKRTATLLAYAALPFAWMVPFVRGYEEKFKEDKIGAGCLLSFPAMIDAAFTVLPLLPYYSNPDPKAIYGACAAPIVAALAKAIGVYFLERERLQESDLIRRGLDRAVEITKNECETLEQKIGDLTSSADLQNRSPYK